MLSRKKITSDHTTTYLIRKTDLDSSIRPRHSPACCGHAGTPRAVRRDPQANPKGYIKYKVLIQAFYVQHC